MSTANVVPGPPPASPPPRPALALVSAPLPAPRGLDRLLRRAVLAALAPVAEGQLTLADGEGSAQVGAPAPDGLAARVEVLRPRFWRRVALSGSLGAAEAYADGDWRADDLTAALRVLARNADALAGVERLSAVRQLLERARRRLRPHTRAGSRRYVAAHYDLGDALFELMLDPTLTYSCAVFERPEATLEEASVAKLDRLCRLLRLRPGDHLLEIGTGWGSMALHAAQRYGCRVTTTTISRHQYLRAAERVRRAGLEDRVEVLPVDYRDLRGRYDKLVSVEMIEAIGAAQYRTFFGHLQRLLRPEGLAAVQAITIADRRFEGARREIDFVKRHVFPGSDLPSVTALLAAATAASDLTLRSLEDIGPHYARTLAAWRRNLEARPEAWARLGDARFRRLWELYLCYCEAGFAERHVSDVQLLLARPRAVLP